MTLTSNQAFRVGDVVTQSIQTTIRNIVPFGVVALIAVGIITVLFMLISTVFRTINDDARSDGSQHGNDGIRNELSHRNRDFGLLAFAIYMLVVAAIVYGTVQDLRGQPVGIGGLLASAVDLVAPALGTVIVLIGVLLAAEIVAYILKYIPILGPIATLVMFAFLNISLWVAIPVAVVERPGPVASLQRSFALTTGNRWKILGIFLLVAAIIVGIVIVMVIFAFISQTIAMILSLLLYAGLFIFGAVLSAVGYYRAARRQGRRGHRRHCQGI